MGNPELKDLTRTEIDVPIEVQMALHVILNHVEPGWENCKAVLNHWLDSIREKDLPK